MGHSPHDPPKQVEQMVQQAQALVGQQYCSPQSTVFYVDGKSFSWKDRDLTIHDDHSKLVFTAENKKWRLRGDKVLKDVDGNSVCSMREKVFSLKSVWTICRGNKTDDASIVGTFTRELGHTDNGGTAKLVGHKGAEFTLQPKRRWVEALGLWLAHLLGETEFDIVQQGQVVGQVARTWSAICFYKHSYRVTVSQGYDQAFILCLVIILEIYSQSHRHTHNTHQNNTDESRISGNDHPASHISQSSEYSNTVAASKP